MTSDENSVTASWKRPWSLNEIISYSNNWSLAGDSGVCELLKRFSSDLITEVTQVNYNLSELQIESKQLNVVMENVSNDLCMLANDQFIENLVEEVHDSGYAKGSHDIVNQSKEERGTQTVSLVMQALRMGLQVLENQFDVIDVTRMGSASRSDNELDSQTIHSQGDFPVNEPIYQPKDPYENRHLPHLIGTADFIDDDTLGIGYIDDVEEEAPAISEDESVSMSSEVRPRQDLLTSSSDEDEDKSVLQGPILVSKEHQHRHVSHLSDEDDDMFDTKSQSEDLFNDDLNNPGSQDLFNDDLDKKHSKVSKVSEEVVEQEEKPLTLMDQLNKQLKARLSIGAKPSEVLAIIEEPLSVSNKVVNEKVEEVVSEKTPVDSNKWSNDYNGEGDNEDEEEDDDIFALPTNKKSKVLGSLNKMPESIASKQHTEQTDQIKSKEIKEQQQPQIIAKPLIAQEEDSDSGDELFGTAKPGKRKEAASMAPVAKARRKTESMSSDDLFDHTSVRTKPSQIGSRNTMPASMLSTTKATTLTRSENKQSTVSKRPTTVINPFHFSSDDDDLDDLFKPVASKKTDVPVSKSTVTIPPSLVTDVSTKKTDVPVVLNPPSPVTSKKSPPTVDNSDSDSIFGFSPSKKVTIQSKNKVEQAPPDKDIVNLQPEEKMEKSQSENKLEKVTKKEIADNWNESGDSDDLFNGKPATTVNKNKSQVKKTESPVLTKKVDSPVITKKVDSPVLTKKVDSPVLTKKVDSPALSKKSDSPIVTKKVTGFDPLSLDLSNASLADSIGQEQSSVKKHTADDDRLPEVTRSIPKIAIDGHVSDQEVNNNNRDLFLIATGVPADSISKPRPSQRVLPPGAISIFGGQRQSSMNNSIMDEMAQRLSKSSLRPNIASGHDNGDDDDNNKPEKISPVEEHREPESRTFQIPNMYRAKQESPEEEKEISLEAPAHTVNQLTNLTKSRARINTRRRPNTKKTEDVTNTEDAEDVTKTEATIIEGSVKMDDPIKVDNAPPMTAVSRGDGDRGLLSPANDDIFANLPPPEKKTGKMKKKESAKSRVSVRPAKEVDVAEIDDIFAVPASKKTTSGKKKTKAPKSATTGNSLIEDPLGPI